ncbi:hypothetical protein ACWDZ4_12580 [Streptomyces sp. NPDC003016]
MTSLWARLPNPHTLAQFAGRAGISEGRARALYAAGQLPDPDSADVDQCPLWSETTIDVWCRTTDRPAQEKALWIFHVPEVSDPVPELFHGLVEYRDAWDRARHIHAIVWDTRYGHIVYVHPVVSDSLEECGVAERDLARAALPLVQPVFWADALVCTFSAVHLPYPGVGEAQYRSCEFDVFRITVREPSPGRRPRSRLFGSAPDPMPAAGPAADIEHGGVVLAPAIARVTGHPVPLWVQGTCTAENVRRARAPQGPITVPDTSSAWPAARHLLEAAVAWKMPDTYPAAFAALASDTAGTLRGVQDQHKALTDSGEGWKLAARPAAPQIPLPLERILGATVEAPFRDAVQELHELHRLEGDLPTTAVHGDAVEHAVQALAYTVAARQPSAVPERIYAYHWPHQGPVGDLLMDQLTRIKGAENFMDGGRAWGTRRIHRLLAMWGEDQLTGIYTDHAGRYVLTLKPDQAGKPPLFLAEWPTALPTGWTKDTVIAADHADGAVGAFALTPVPDGHTRVEPVPFTPRSGPPFTYGDTGSYPWALYTALVRCATGSDGTDPGFDTEQLEFRREHSSELHNRIRAAKDQLRLPWPRVQEWARNDLPA